MRYWMRQWTQEPAFQNLPPMATPLPRPKMLYRNAQKTGLVSTCQESLLGRSTQLGVATTGRLTKIPLPVRAPPDRSHVTARPATLCPFVLRCARLPM
jgi:hypothetical protein